jgi:hypothetical protein
VGLVYLHSSCCIRGRGGIPHYQPPASAGGESKAVEEVSTTVEQSLWQRKQVSRRHQRVSFIHPYLRDQLSELTLLSSHTDQLMVTLTHPCDALPRVEGHTLGAWALATQGGGGATRVGDLQAMCAQIQEATVKACVRCLALPNFGAACSVQRVLCSTHNVPHAMTLLSP